jgi:hypothetical protein
MQILTILLWDTLLMVREGFRWVSVGHFLEADFVWENSDYFRLNRSMWLIFAVTVSNRCKRTPFHRE